MFEWQRRAMEKVSKKGDTSTKKRETNTKKGKTTVLVLVDDILFHKGAPKHRVKSIPRSKSQEEVLKIVTSKKFKAEAIRYAIAIVAGKKKRLLPLPPNIDPIFSLVMEYAGHKGDPSSSRKRKYKKEVGSIPWNDLKVTMQPNSFRFVNNCLARRRVTVDEFGKPLVENESDRDWMMKLSAYVMTKYDNRLGEVE